jgi:hypothetical protein
LRLKPSGIYSGVARWGMVIYELYLTTKYEPVIMRLITNNGPESSDSLEAVSVPSTGARDPRRMCFDASESHYNTLREIGIP